MGPSEQQQKAGKAPSALEAALQCEEDLADDAAASPGMATPLQQPENQLLQAQKASVSSSLVLVIACKSCRLPACVNSCHLHSLL